MNSTSGWVSPKLTALVPLLVRGEALGALDPQGSPLAATGPLPLSEAALRWRGSAMVFVERKVRGSMAAAVVVCVLQA